MSLKETSDLLKNLFKDKKAANLTLDNGQVLHGVLPIRLEQKSYGSIPVFTYKDEHGTEHTIEVSHVSAVENNPTIEISHELATSNDFWRSSLFSPLGLNTFSSTSSSVQSLSSSSLFGENKHTEDLFKSTTPVHSPNSATHSSTHLEESIVHDTASTTSDKAQDFFDQIHSEAEKAEQKVKEKVDVTTVKVEAGKKSIGSTILKVLFFIVFIAILASAISPIFKAVFNKATGVPAPEPTVTQIVNRDFLYGEKDTMVTDAGIYYDGATLPARDAKTDTDFSVATLSGLTDKAQVKTIESSNNQCFANLQNLTIPSDTELYPAGSTSKEASDAILKKVYLAYNEREKEAGRESSKATLSTVKLQKIKPGTSPRNPNYDHLEMSELVLTRSDGFKTYIDVRVVPSAHKALVISNNCSIDFKDMQDKLPDIKYFVAGLS